MAFRLKAGLPAAGYVVTPPSGTDGSVVYGAICNNSQFVTVPSNIQTLVLT